MKKKNKAVRFIIILAVITLIVTAVLLFVVTSQQKNNQFIEIDGDTMKLIQLDPPEDGDPIAIVETTLGEFRFRLFPEQSPNAVKNFTELAESGFYNDTWVFDSNSGAYAAMGSSSRLGEYEKGTARERVERELSQDLWSFRGAVCMSNTDVERTLTQRFLGGGTVYNGSRFEVFNTIEFDEETEKNFREASEYDELEEAYITLGGIPNFAQQMTVIGQTYEGLDVVEALTKLDSESNGRYMIPKEEVKIISVTISTYSK